MQEETLGGSTQKEGDTKEGQALTGRTLGQQLPFPSNLGLCNSALVVMCLSCCP